MMKLLFLHGAPAVGKYTVGKAVLDLVPGRLFDNHVAIRFARSIYDFNHPAFWRLVFDTRFRALESAALWDIPLLVTTACFADPEDLRWYAKYEKIVGRYGGEVLPVFLDCPIQILEQRVVSPERTMTGKLDDPERLGQYLSGPAMTPVPRPNCLSLDTDRLTPAESARRIVDHFDLTKLPKDCSFAGIARGLEVDPLPGDEVATPLP